MDILLAKFVASFVLPPGGNLVAGFGGLVLARWRPRLGAALVWLSLLSLLAMSIPAISESFLRDSEPYPAVDLDAVPLARIGAIVVLGGGRYPRAPEYGADTVSDASLVRARYAALLHRRTTIPLLVTGGTVRGEAVAEADLIAGVLESEFSVPVRWREKRARNTAQNAVFSAEILAAEGIRDVLLVTHADHMARSVSRFEAAGLTVWPAPTRFHMTGHGARSIWSWLPKAGALQTSRRVLHEWVGRIWYALRY